MASNQPVNMNFNIAPHTMQSNMNRQFASTGSISNPGTPMPSNGHTIMNNQSFQQHLMDHSKPMQFGSNMPGMMNNSFQSSFYQNTAQQLQSRMSNTGNPFIGNPNVNNNPGKDNKLKMIQQQLVLILHAQRCAQVNKNIQQRPIGNTCCYTYCPQAKKILSHVEFCTKNDCSIDHCRSTKEILYHWKQCNNIHCCICLPVRISNFLKIISLYSFRNSE